MGLPNYFEINQYLDEMESVISAAEIHGILCGIICAGKYMNGKSWLNATAGALGSEDFIEIPSFKQCLLNLYETSNVQLHGHDFDFEMLLPDDTEPLAMRASCLTQWCHGFLYGIGLAGTQMYDYLTEEGQNVLHHLTEIGKLDHEDISSSEEDEVAFFEVLEYTRMGVIMVYTELSDSHHQHQLQSFPKDERCH